MNIFYISYDGLTDFVSQSQVLPYLEMLSKKGYEITFLSFEKKNKDFGKETAYYKQRLEEGRIDWIGKRYHRRPAMPATIFDILHGISAGISVLRNKKIDVIHVRGYVAACMGFVLKYLFQTRIIFDMRGFWADEKVDAESWKENGILHFVFKRLEQLFISKADEIVVLTDAAKRSILSGHPASGNITVIPCCANTHLFKASSFDVVNPPGRRIALYAGSLGSFYNLDEILNFFDFLREMDKSFFLRIVSGYRKEAIEGRAISRNIGISYYSVERLGRDDMPGAFAQAEFSIIFYNRKLSGEGCCPIKFGESLASGVPVVINSGIGDCDKIVTDNKVGVLLRDFSKAEYKRAFDAIEGFRKERGMLRQRCVEVASKLFSLETGIEKYENVYKRLAG